MFELTDEQKKEIQNSNKILSNAEWEYKQERERIKKSWESFVYVMDQLVKNDLTDYKLYRDVWKKREFKEPRYYWSGEREWVYYQIIFSYNDLCLIKKPNEFTYLIMQTKKFGLFKKNEQICTFKSYGVAVSDIEYEDQHLHLFESFYQSMSQAFFDRVNSKSYKLEVSTESLKLIYPFGGK